MTLNIFLLISIMPIANLTYCRENPTCANMASMSWPSPVAQLTPLNHTLIYIHGTGLGLRPKYTQADYSRYPVLYGTKVFSS